MSDSQRPVVQQVEAQTGGTVRDVTQVYIEQLVVGVARLPTDYATRIRNFMTAYLGTPERPVPFGGRDNALAELDRWLDDPDVPYLLLTAPAGRGKSALLVRWVAALQARRSDLRIAFVPVSIRYGTSLASVAFAALAAQLAAIFGEPVPAGADTPDEVWRGICASYLSRTPPGPLLVVLDGIDEAANWGPDAALFPLDPPPGLKVAVSARQTATYPTADAWKHALGWDRVPPVRTLELERLSPEGVADVLRKMGFPLDVLGARVDIVAELHRLSEGDPLLVRLYVDDLWERGEEAARLQPEDLRSIRPGYEGYFDRWWDDQRRLWGTEAPMRERSVREVLNLLSAALGPLTKEDLLHLARLGGAELDSWTLEEALRPLARFIVRTGEGYVFGHPKLGDYFFGRLTPDEQRALEARFLRWGGETLEALRGGSVSPAGVPAYLVRYYRAHLGRAGAPLEKYRPLVEIGSWAEAWYGQEGSYGGYLGDVQAVWERAAAEDRRATAGGHIAPHLGTEIRCALIEASIHSLAGNIPPELLAALVEKGVWTPAAALTYARQMPDEEKRAKALAGLAPHLPEDLLREALDAAREIGNEDARAHALAELAPHLPEDLLQEALAVAREISWKSDRAEALAGLALRLAELGYPQEALAVARVIWDKSARARALAELAPHLPEDLREQALREALAAARGIRDESDRAETLAGLAPHLPADLRKQALREALAAAREISWESARAEALAGLAPRLAELGRYDEALAVTREIGRESAHAEALAGLALRLAELGYPQEALAAVREIGDESARAKALAGLAPHLPEDLLREALAAAREIRDGSACARALAGLAPHLPENLLQEALAAAREIRDKSARARALAELTPHLAVFPRLALYPLWAETLPVLARRTRRDLLSDIRALKPVIHALGGEAAVVETFRAIQDVGRWWP